MKSKQEIIFAHDALSGAILGDIPVELDDSNLKLLTAACDVLCWVLEHSHNEHFQKNLDTLLAEARSHGYELSRRSDLARPLPSPAQEAEKGKAAL